MKNHNYKLLLWSTFWVLAAGLTLVFPKITERLSPTTIFGFFCSMMCIQLVWVKLMMPETKGISLEEIQKKLKAD